MDMVNVFTANDKKFIFDGESVRILEYSDNFFTNVKIKQSNKLNAHRFQYLKTTCLVLNNSCNLSCDYCFANKGKYDKPNEQMSFDIAKQAVNLLIKSVKKNNGINLTIAFFGGEPLLSYELIKKIVYYTETISTGINCEYMITTNATLITKEIAEFMLKYKFDIMFSIDGKEYMHNFYRKYKNGKASYKDVLYSLNFFKKKENLNARITITDINPEIHTYIDDILNLNIKRITFAVDYNISKYNFLKFIKSLNLLIKKFFYDIRNGKLYDITNFSSIIVSLVLNQRKSTHCNAGISYITVSADGKYYRCPRFIGNKEFQLENINFFRESLDKDPKKRNIECGRCIYVYLCGGTCYHHAFSLGSNQFDVIKNECIQKKIIFNNIIKSLCELSLEERRQLLLYYIKLWNFREEVQLNDF